MKHFQKPDATVWAFELDGSQDHLITPDMVALTDEALALLRAPSLAQQIAEAVRRIDADADAIYGAVLGNRGEEYKSAEADAQAFRDAAYAGPVPAGVASWVAASGMTAQAAADDILATAATWRDAMTQIRAQRLLCKAQVQTDVDAALAQWAGFAAGVRASLGLN